MSQFSTWKYEVVGNIEVCLQEPTIEIALHMFLS